jgi:excisionase family DNA binding protein
MQQRLAIRVKEAAEMLGISHWTLRAYIRKGHLKAVRIGTRVLIEPSELERLIEQGRWKGQE